MPKENFRENCIRVKTLLFSFFIPFANEDNKIILLAIKKRKTKDKSRKISRRNTKTTVVKCVFHCQLYQRYVFCSNV